MKKKKLEELFYIDDQDEFDIQLAAVTEFVQEGLEHGTLVEATLWIIQAVKENPGMRLEEILYDAASEWYK